jgi:hypothetical protein
MADNLIYEMSASTQMDGEPFTRRDVLYVVDSNQGSYAGVNQIIYDTASLSNSGKWCNYSEAYLEIPLTVVLSNTNADFSGNIKQEVGADFLVGLKSGFHQIVNSISVEMNNTSIIQQTNLTNAHISYRLNTQSSLNDVSLNGSTTGHIPDGSLSWEYSATSGSRNNNIMTASTNIVNTGTGSAGIDRYNDGFTSRLQLAKNVDSGLTANGGRALMTTSNVDT